MRVLAAWILALGLFASPVTARAHRAGDDTTAKTDTDKNATANPRPADATPGSKASGPAKTDAAATPTPASMEVELHELRDLIEMQSKQLEEQNEQLKEQQKKMQMLEEQLNASGASRAGTSSTGTVSPAASVASTPGVAAPSVMTAAVANTPAGSGPSPSPVPAAHQDMNSEEPVALHFKGVTLTPGGFMVAETVYRSKALSADVNTPFNSAPLPGSSPSNISEFNASGRQSRISMLVEGKLKDVKIGGYYEGDFLGAGSTSNNNQSNSYVFRQRQFWGQAAFNSGFTVTGGQMWSLVTQTAVGMDNRTEVTPLVIDAQYVAGFSWARQYGVRFVQNFSNKFWLGFSVENPQITVTVHGEPTTTTGAVTIPCVGDPGCPASGTVTVGTTTTYTNFLLGQSGTSGGLFNPLANYSYNPSPDLIFKAVLEPGIGHYELFGIYSRFRDRIFPCEVASVAIASCTVIPSAQLAFNQGYNGGGFGGNAYWSMFAKHLDFGLHGMAGNGIGRYGSAGLADATIRPDGTIALLKNYMALGSLILHPVPKLDLYAYGGGDYAARAQYAKTVGGIPNEGYGAIGFNNSGCYVEISPTETTPAGTTAGAGYVPGALSNCTGDARDILEGTLGFWYRFYQGSRGRVQLGMQYSYYERNTWRGVAPAAGAPGAGIGNPDTDENMWFTSLRYYLP
ncbi:MAG TPA: hypothetical protein VEJ67_14335 [Candidatus Cybelea sp.]|nr:hypothetical protein [Candidatus Cybelea sp.]